MRRPPSLDPEALDPRSEPYRDRAGRVSRADGSRFANVYVRTEVYWRSAGVLRREWTEPTEALHGCVEYADGHFEDFVTDVDVLAAEIDRWNHGVWTIDGEVMVVEWLDREQTAAFRSERGYESPSY